MCARARAHQRDLDGLKHCVAEVIDELHHLGVICVVFAYGVDGL